MANRREYAPSQGQRWKRVWWPGRTASAIALVAILALAATLRFWNLGATEFKFDEARVANLAARFVDTGVPPLRGMGSSTGIDNPPLAVYLMSVPVLLSRDPLVATAFVALLNVTAVWACYALGRRHWGDSAGLLAALLLATSPWAVFYSRKVWAQNLLLPFVLLFMALLYAWLIEGRRWALAGAVVTLAALTQIHFAALALVPLFALALLLAAIQHWRQRRTATVWAPLALGLAIGLLTYAPYLIADARDGWPNINAILNTSRAPVQTRWETVRYALLNVGGRQIHALAGPERYRDFLAMILDLAYWPDRVEEALVVTGVVYLVYRCWRARRDRRDSARYGLLLLWLVVPVLSFLPSRTPVYPHYLIPLYPAPYLALAIAARDVVQAVGARVKRAKPLYALFALLLCVLVAWQGYLSLSIHAYVDQHHTPGGMGTPVRILRQVVDTMEQYAQEWDNPRVVLLCPGDNPRWDECPAVFGFMTSSSLDVRFVDGRASLLFPQSEADTLIVLAAEATSPAGEMEPGAGMAAAGEIGRFAEPLPGADISLRENVGAYHFFRVRAGEAPAPPIRPDEATARLANGVELRGYELSDSPAPGRTTRLTLHWRVQALPVDPPVQGYSFANHVLATDGRRIGQRDGPGYRVELWRAGDTLVSWFDIALDEDAPSPPYRLRTGMYVYTPPDQFVTIPIVDAQGQPVAEAVEWVLPWPAR